MLTPDCEMTLSIPRDRHGRFDPVLIAKYQRRFPGFDAKIVALYARGMSTRDIQAHIRELYGVDWTDQISVDTRCSARSASQTLPVACRQRNHVGGSGCRTSRCNRTRRMPRRPGKVDPPLDRLFFSTLKKLSATALSWQFPRRLMLGTIRCAFGNDCQSLLVN